MSSHTIKSYLTHLMRFNPETGEKREDGERAMVTIDSNDLLLDEVHADFVLGTRAVQHASTGRYVPITYKSHVVHRQTMVAIANIKSITVHQ